MAMLDDLLAEDQASGDFDPNSLLGALMKRQLPAGHPSGMLMWIRDQIPQVQADDTSTMSGIGSRLLRTATGVPRAGLETMANWLRGTHDPNAVRIGEDTIAPLGLFGMAGLAGLAGRGATAAKVMADNAKSSVPGTVVNAMGEAGARTPRTIGDELLAMGTDQSKFMSTLDSLKLTKAEWDDLANHFTNAPSNGQYRYKFKNVDEAKKKIRDVFIERYEAKSKREIINRMTKWPGEDSAQASPLASAPGLAANATQGPTEPMLAELLRQYGMGAM